MEHESVSGSIIRRSSSRKHIKRRPRPERGNVVNWQPPLISGEKYKDIRKQLAPFQRIQLLFSQTAGDEYESHPIFTEMLELKSSEPGNLWQERARWLKFEEDVEVDGNRWSKPHVATLSLHSWFELRSCLMTGVVMLDVEATQITEIINQLMDHLSESKTITYEVRELLSELLLRKHEHQYEHEGKYPGHKMLNKIRSLAEIGKQTSKERSIHDSLSTLGSCSSVNETDEKKEGVKFAQKQPLIESGYLPKRGSAVNFKDQQVADGGTFGPKRGSVVAFKDDLKHMGENTPTKRGSINLLRDNSFTSSKTPGESTPTKKGSTHLLRESSFKGNVQFLKKIPANAEAAVVLLGYVDELKTPISSFIRLKQSIHLPNFAEAPIPIKFLFFIFGPSGRRRQYHEIGRALGTIITDDIFCEVAYKARNYEDLLDGIDEFLDQVTILPPGEWDPAIRIEPPSIPAVTEKRKLTTACSEAPEFEELEIIMKENERTEELSLKRTGRLFGCLFNDISQKLNFYKSDFVDGVNLHCFATVLYMYIALLAPIVTLGGVYKASTGQRMAVVESLIGCSISGIIFALFSAQPLAIISSTGPVLVFEKVLFDLCQNNLDYLAFRYWVNIWCAIMLFIFIAFDGSVIVSYVTRFTEEAFTLLVSVVFIAKAVTKIFDQFYQAHLIAFDQTKLSKNPYCGCVSKSVNVSLPESSIISNYSNRTIIDIPVVNCSKVNGELEDPFNHCYFMLDVFLMSLLLAFGSFCLAYFFRHLKRSIYFPSYVRKFFGLFGVIITFILMVIFDELFQLNTPKLYIPPDFQPTWKERSWIVNPFNGNAWWTVLLAIVPAFFLSILIFMDHNVTLVVVNRRENKLKKGHGYHLDLFILCFGIIISGVFGLPIFVAATIMSISHVKALRIENECQAPGEEPTITGVHEQRLTALLVYIFIGLSVLLTNVLTYIPMAVLFGIFFFMGVTALEGVQLVDRILLFFKPVKYQPDYIYLRHVPLKRVHFFTFIQFVCFLAMFVVKEIYVISIFFPLMILGTMFVRKLMEYEFTEEELRYLDDQLPESLLRQKEDDERTEKEKATPNEEENKNENLLDKPDLHIPLPSGNIIKIPMASAVNKNVINISEEVNRSGIWKHIASEASFGSTEHFEKGRPKLRQLPKQPKVDLDHFPDELKDEGITMKFKKDA